MNHLFTAFWMGTAIYAVLSILSVIILAFVAPARLKAEFEAKCKEIAKKGE